MVGAGGRPGGDGGEAACSISGRRCAEEAQFPLPRPKGRLTPPPTLRALRPLPKFQLLPSPKFQLLPLPGPSPAHSTESRLPQASPPAETAQQEQLKLGGAEGAGRVCYRDGWSSTDLHGSGGTEGVGGVLQRGEADAYCCGCGGDWVRAASNPGHPGSLLAVDLPHPPLLPLRQNSRLALPIDSPPPFCSSHSATVAVILNNPLIINPTAPPRAPRPHLPTTAQLRPREGTGEQLGGGGGDCGCAELKKWGGTGGLPRELIAEQTSPQLPAASTYVSQEGEQFGRSRRHPRVEIAVLP